MTVEISWPAVSTGCVVATFIGKIIHGLFTAALEKRDGNITLLVNDLEKNKLAGEVAVADLKTTHGSDVANLKATQALLFTKYDSSVRELHEYKLHVAETYVNREVLREQLSPINESLKEIRHELQEERRK